MSGRLRSAEKIQLVRIELPLRQLLSLSATQSNPRGCDERSTGKFVSAEALGEIHFWKSPANAERTLTTVNSQRTTRINAIGKPLGAIKAW